MDVFADNAAALFLIFSLRSGYQVKDKPETCRLCYSESSHNIPTQNAIQAMTHRNTVFRHLQALIRGSAGDAIEQLFEIVAG